VSRITDLVRESFGVGASSEETVSSLLSTMFAKPRTDPGRDRVELAALAISVALKALVEGDHRTPPDYAAQRLHTPALLSLSAEELAEALDTAIASLSRSYGKVTMRQARRAMVSILENIGGLKLRAGDRTDWDQIATLRSLFRQPSPALHLGIVQRNPMDPTPRLSVREAVRRSLRLA